MNSAVIGLGFGDEGKGKVVDWLCSQNPGETLVVRFSGGHQCAHTVNCNDIEHVFSNFGSGTLRGCPTYWSSLCTFEPIGFFRELEVLKKKGIEPKIMFHPAAMVTTPWDIKANHIGEECRHGTTGVGFWRTIKRNREGFNLSLINWLNCKFKFKDFREYYFGWDCDNELLNDWLLLRERFLAGKFQLISFPQIQHNFKRKVFEGNQGLLLDKNSKFFPHVTPSSTNIDNVYRLGSSIDEIFLVTRAYQTRHGNGPMTNVCLPLDIIEQKETATKTNPFQGSLRKSILDIDLLIEGLKLLNEGKEKKKHLVVNCLDQMKKFVFTKNQKLYECSNKEEFLKTIANCLNIDGNIYFSSGKKMSLKKLS